VTARVRAWLPAVAWGALIFLVSSRPTIPVALESGTDKIAHCLVYAVLGALLARGQVASGISVGAAATLGLLYAASDEWHQSFVPGRSADAADWIADAVGVVLGLTLYHRGRRRWARPDSARPGVRTDPIPHE